MQVRRSKISRWIVRNVNISENGTWNVMYNREMKLNRDVTDVVVVTLGFRTLNYLLI